MGTASTGRVPSPVDYSYLHPWQLLPLSVSSDRMVGCEMVSVKSVNGAAWSSKSDPAPLVCTRNEPQMTSTSGIAQRIAVTNVSGRLEIGRMSCNLICTPSCSGRSSEISHWCGPGQDGLYFRHVKYNLHGTM